MTDSDFVAAESTAPISVQANQPPVISTVGGDTLVVASVDPWLPFRALTRSKEARDELH